MMKKLFFFLFIAYSLAACGQLQTNRNELKVMFYNVENLFDPSDEPGKIDEEFMPDGLRHWTYKRYYRKLGNISKVIAAVGEWNPPALIGLCEIENETCIRELTKQAALKTIGYKYVHKESPDARGIDVALLYRPEMYQPVREEFIEIRFPREPERKTRDILYSTGVLTDTGDTLHVFVNHFPSRTGGELVSEPNRLFVASQLRHKVDSLFAVNPQSLIVIMGDFNDHPDNRSISDVLQAKALSEPYDNASLYNLYRLYHAQGKGSYKYQGEWGALDQIIVSGALLTGKSNLTTSQKDAHIFEADFLLEPDKVGLKPKRTYLGYRYNNGGYSDHLPVYTLFKVQKNEP